MAAGGGIPPRVLTGAPINEPTARDGPFVLNSQANIRHATDGFGSGRFGGSLAWRQPPETRHRQEAS